jgi:hypothetical protein
MILNTSARSIPTPPGSGRTDTAPKRPGIILLTNLNKNVKKGRIRMKKLIIFIILLFGLVGCGHRGHWTKADFSAEQYRTDVYQCKMDAERGTFRTGTGVIYLVARRNWFNECMRMKGYEFVK